MNIFRKLFGAKRRKTEGLTANAEAPGLTTSTRTAGLPTSANVEEPAALPTFRFEQTKDLAKALQALRDDAFPRLSPIDRTKALAEFESLPWPSKKIVEGALEDILALVKRNMEKVRARPDFVGFGVELYEDQHCVQVQSVHGRGASILVDVHRVWPIHDAYIFAGSSPETIYDISDDRVNAQATTEPAETKTDPLPDTSERITITVSDDPFGRSIKKAFDHAVQNYPQGTFGYCDMPAFEPAYLSEVGASLKGKRAVEADEETGLDPATYWGCSKILGELKNVNLIETSGYMLFCLTEKGKQSDVKIKGT